ncbi:hypothetical protein Pedsa_2422 [Pseudopedobacter saltans DSM 12145]|uniref:Uncharacterized protein n=1 Tax=Pseudopedobacter saltans (strain ATCC 51119 / DSM 12145 / JCM 21818 / CCUG 39354 / LMG 10337 / NBRC 100064 / NCIMB 13643) TaxID=762903 RepID=F0SE44_PSESL|nr:hypothetical protein [Pseudopedobacter saltans]ADY52970.1 hypothetical protein Pedsa_2422 [Pseudopedobacter saltans DSM 12145]
MNLGQYDMVLALSDSKVSYEFNQLLKQKRVSDRWHFLSNLDGEYIANTGSNFEITRQAWLNQKDETRITDYANYDILMDVTVAGFKVTFFKDSHTELLFKIIIKEGEFCYFKNGNMNKCDLAGMEYAFRVPVSKLRITSKDMYMLDEKSEEKLREEGFNDNDFLIDSIFLDFQRADVNQYSVKDSLLPKGISKLTYLQIALANYFKSLGSNKDNPYILGYTVRKKKLIERDKALLYPTGASFSISYSNNVRESAFNFLLLTDHHQFPEAPQGGRIDKSLVESASDKTTTASGVIAIDFQTFKNNYLDTITAKVTEAFKESFEDSGYYDSDSRSESKVVFKCSKGGASMDFSLEKDGIRDVKESKCISIDYIIKVSGNVHEEKSALIGTVGVNQKFSTNGKYEINKKKGKEGTLKIRLRASSEGKIEIEPLYEAPLVGRDSDGPEYKHGLDRLWSGISDFFAAIAGVQMAYTESLLSRIGSELGEMTFKGIQDFSNKVILPGSNVYTFKDIRLLNGKQDNSDAVLFDIAYALT